MFDTILLEEQRILGKAELALIMLCPERLIQKNKKFTFEDGFSCRVLLETI